MIKALDMINRILRSAQFSEVTTIEGTRAPNTEKTLQALNDVGLALGNFIDWRFLHTTFKFQTIAEYTTGTAAFTKGSKSVVGTSTVWQPDMVGRQIKSRAFEEHYTVAAIGSATTLTLEHEFNGTTNATSTYTIAQNRYELPDDLDTELSALQFVTPANIRLVSPEEFDEYQFGPRGFIGNVSPMITDDPLLATIVTDSTGRQSMLFMPFPEDQILILFKYYRMVLDLEKDQDFWPFPPYLRRLLTDGALHFINRDLRGEAQKAQMQFGDFFNSRNELLGKTRKTDPISRVSPWTGIRRRRKIRHNRIRPGVENEWALGTVRPI